MACHAQGNGYQFFQDTRVKSQFWGKSIEFITYGTVHVTLESIGEDYSWSKVNSCMRNIFSTNRNVEHYGKMKITNKTTGHYALVHFKESGYFSSSKNEVSAELFNPNGVYQCSISGKWNESLFRFHKSNPDNLLVIWRASPMPFNHADMYGFTHFALELNEITLDLNGKLPSTDTRNRPDQRMYENGLLDPAEAEKQRLELKQREKRKQMQHQGLAWTPQWFRLVELGDETERTSSTSDGKAWRFNGNYWKERGNFKNFIDLW